MLHSAASDVRDIHFEKSLVCFYDICKITTFDSPRTDPVINAFMASIKSFQHLLPSEILTVSVRV